MRKHTKEDEDFIRDNLRYDSETGHLWWIKPSENGVRTPRNLNKPVGYNHKGYFRVNIFPTGPHLSHRVVWFLYYKCWPNGSLDHINGVRNDNKINNLREVTSQQNATNARKKKSGGSSQYKGVSFNKAKKKWEARACTNYKDKRLGYYASEEEAARAYDKAARERFGDYACLNFPEEHEQGALNGHDL